MLGVVFAITRFRQYVLGQPFQYLRIISLSSVLSVNYYQEVSHRFLTHIMPCRWRKDTDSLCIQNTIDSGKNVRSTRKGGISIRSEAISQVPRTDHRRRPEDLGTV